MLGDMFFFTFVDGLVRSFKVNIINIVCAYRFMPFIKERGTSATRGGVGEQRGWGRRNHRKNYVK